MKIDSNIMVFIIKQRKQKKIISVLWSGIDIPNGHKLSTNRWKVNEFK